MSETQQQPEQTKIAPQARREKPKYRSGSGADHTRLSRTPAPKKHNHKDLVYQVNRNGQRSSRWLKVLGSPVPGTGKTLIYQVQLAYWIEGEPSLETRWVSEAWLRQAQDADKARYEAWLTDVQMMPQQREIVTARIRRDKEEQWTREQAARGR